MVDGQNSILLSFINDYLSVPINKMLDELYKENYKEYKRIFIGLSARLYDFREELNAEFGGYFNEY